jgi:hypothetical protein
MKVIDVEPCSSMAGHLQSYFPILSMYIDFFFIILHAPSAKTENT